MQNKFWHSSATLTNQNPALNHNWFFARGGDDNERWDACDEYDNEDADGNDHGDDYKGDDSDDGVKHKAINNYQ